VLLIEAIGKLRASGRLAYLVLVGQGGDQRDLEEAAANYGVLDTTIFPRYHHREENSNAADQRNGSFVYLALSGNINQTKRLGCWAQT